MEDLLFYSKGVIPNDVLDIYPIPAGEDRCHPSKRKSPGLATDAPCRMQLTAAAAFSGDPKPPLAEAIWLVKDWFLWWKQR